MGGRGQACARKKHIGPIDPDACTLNQFLNSLEIRATADVLVDGGEVWIKMLAHCGAHCIGRAKSVPDSRQGNQECDAGFWALRAPSLLMPRPNAREDSYLY
jgi:hypothetical protein